MYQNFNALVGYFSFVEYAFIASFARMHIKKENLRSSFEEGEVLLVLLAVV